MKINNQTSCRIFIKHEPLDGLLLVGKGNYFIEGDLEARLSKSTDLFKKKYLQVYNHLLGLIDKNFLLSGEKLAEFKENCKRRDQHQQFWFPFSFNQVSDPQFVSSEYNALPGESSALATLSEACQTFDDKVFVERLVQDQFSTFVIPRTKIISGRDTKTIQQYITEFGKIVIKLPSGSGGQGSFIVEEEIPPLGGSVIIQPFLETIHSPSITYLISQEEIEELYISDQKIEGLSYWGTSFPSKTRFKEKIKKFGQSFCRVLHQHGYRGYCNFDFVETEENVFFSEINPRVPYSLYPFAFFTHQGGSSFEVSQEQVYLDNEAKLRVDSLIEKREIIFFLRECNSQMIYRRMKISP